TTMPQLGIDDNRLAWVSGVWRSASSAGIKKATPLMNRKEVDVTISETIMIDQRALGPSWPAVSTSVAIPHANCGSAHHDSTADSGRPERTATPPRETARTPQTRPGNRRR